MTPTTPSCEASPPSPPPPATFALTASIGLLLAAASSTVADALIAHVKSVLPAAAAADAAAADAAAADAAAADAAAADATTCSDFIIQAPRRRRRFPCSRTLNSRWRCCCSAASATSVMPPPLAAVSAAASFLTLNVLHRHLRSSPRSDAHATPPPKPRG